MIKISDLTFTQYFQILEALNKDQYNYTQNAKGKMVRDKNPIAKEKRTDEFLFEIHRDIVKQMCNLGVEYVSDDTFIVLCWDLISEKLDQINILIAHEGMEEITETYDFKGSKLAYVEFDKWTFNKWVTLENAMKGIAKEDAIGNIETEHGAKFILPLVFGEWVDSLPDWEEKYDLFNNKLLAKDIALVFAKVNNRINALKSAHNPMYSSEQNDSGGRAYKLHVELFGWQETLKNLAEKRVFGGYLETKSAPLLQVLEYLNCSVSAELAKEKDFEAANKKAANR
jgi:hypothetical protein